MANPNGEQPPRPFLSFKGDRFAAFDDQAILDPDVPGNAEWFSPQFIERSWRAVEAQQILLRQGRARFGPPNQNEENAILAIEDLEQLEQLSLLLLVVQSWQELLA